MTADEEFEREAAATLGRALMRFSRLDMELALCLAWLDGGRDLEARAKATESASFHQKLNALTTWLDNSVTDEDTRSAYKAWIADANALRLVRNDWTHGRWAILEKDRVLVNVIGFPMARGQRERRYSLGEMRLQVEAALALGDRLVGLRKQRPI